MLSHHTALLAVVLLLVAPAAQAAPPTKDHVRSAPHKKPVVRNAGKKPAKTVRKGAKPTRRTARRYRPRQRSRRVASRCRDIFCTAEVVRMDSGDADPGKLSQDQVEQFMQRAQTPLEPCMVEARRRDPEMVQARVEVVVDNRGLILASRVNGKRFSPLARCMHRRLRPIRFPKSGMKRTVAAFTIGIPH